MATENQAVVKRPEKRKKNKKRQRDQECNSASGTSDGNSSQKRAHPEGDVSFISSADTGTTTESEKNISNVETCRRKRERSRGGKKKLGNEDNKTLEPTSDVITAETCPRKRKRSRGEKKKLGNEDSKMLEPTSDVITVETCPRKRKRSRGEKKKLGNKDSKTLEPTSDVITAETCPRKRKRSRGGKKKLGNASVCSPTTTKEDDVKATLSQPADELHKRKLLILDVNGLLADIVFDFPEGYTPDIFVSNKAVFKRPFCDDFLKFCFERFNVGIWSSRTKRNLDMVNSILMGSSRKKLLFCFDRSHCTKTKFTCLDDKNKPIVLKELRKLWDKVYPGLPWEKGEYNESNTLLLDDSPYKALLNPPNTAIFPHPYHFKNVEDKALGRDGDLRLYLEKLVATENVQKFIEQNPFGQRAITESSCQWKFYSRIRESIL